MDRAVKVAGGGRGRKRGTDRRATGKAFPRNAGRWLEEPGGEGKPILYLTRDNDGLFLWFGLEAPILVAYHGGGGKRRFKNPLAQAVRLPAFWYGRLIRPGECRPYDPEDLFR
ncbi:MAG: hypothetical protein LBE84_12620 [Planctomycetota bacterium]|jgi:hypothetical protein|nr:hypothetical protein [Planctomycetota bacterium]